MSVPDVAGRLAELARRGLAGLARRRQPAGVDARGRHRPAAARERAAGRARCAHAGSRAGHQRRGASLRCQPAGLSKDHGGDENTQLWLRDLADGRRAAADRRQVAHRTTRVRARWPAHRLLRQCASIRPATTSSCPTSTARPVRAWCWPAAARICQVEDWSLDDTQLAVIRYRSITDSELLLVDVASGESDRHRARAARKEPARQAACRGPVSVGEARFARDGRGLYFTSDRGGEFMALHYLDLHQQQLTTLTPDTRWDVERFELSPDGRFLAYTLNEAGPLAPGAARPAPAGRRAAATAARRRGDRRHRLRPSQQSSGRRIADGAQFPAQDLRVRHQRR